MFHDSDRKCNIGTCICELNHFNISRKLQFTMDVIQDMFRQSCRCNKELHVSWKAAMQKSKHSIIRPEAAPPNIYAVCFINIDCLQITNK